MFDTHRTCIDDHCLISTLHIRFRHNLRYRIRGLFHNRVSEEIVLAAVLTYSGNTGKCRRDLHLVASSIDGKHLACCIHGHRSIVKHHRIGFILVQFSVIGIFFVVGDNGDRRHRVHIQCTVCRRNRIGIETSIGECIIKGIGHATRHRQGNRCRIVDSQHITRRQCIGRSMGVSIVGCSLNSLCTILHYKGIIEMLITIIIEGVAGRSNRNSFCILRNGNFTCDNFDNVIIFHVTGCISQIIVNDEYACRIDTDSIRLSLVVCTATCIAYARNFVSCNQSVGSINRVIWRGQSISGVSGTVIRNRASGGHRQLEIFLRNNEVSSHWNKRIVVGHILVRSILDDHTRDGNTTRHSASHTCTTLDCHRRKYITRTQICVIIGIIRICTSSISDRKSGVCTCYIISRNGDGTCSNGIGAVHRIECVVRSLEIVQIHRNRIVGSNRRRCSYLCFQNRSSAQFVSIT